MRSAAGPRRCSAQHGPAAGPVLSARLSLSLLSVSTSVSLSLFLTKRFSARIESERHKKAFQILRVSVSAERSGGEETPGGSEELIVDSPSALNLKHSYLTIPQRLVRFCGTTTDTIVLHAALMSLVRG